MVPTHNNFTIISLAGQNDYSKKPSSTLSEKERKKQTILE